MKFLDAIPSAVAIDINEIPISISISILHPAPGPIPPTLPVVKGAAAIYQRWAAYDVNRLIDLGLQLPQGGDWDDIINFFPRLPGAPRFSKIRSDYVVPSFWYHAQEIPENLLWQLSFRC
ncbi:hypothetical protein CKAN_02386500 [Cinnamomum micranthum f. kanehirae]|uniref:Uncharacterized protein n=1 Tax=Cinnamomum micranthum f. kanehirae TaxID=337451 RepID=A0A3S3P6I4_9MAGN|nr:hypothetical protein CKAN_02386500 [Cinnamomum micranthum f. kanehirae]